MSCRKAVTNFSQTGDASTNSALEILQGAFRAPESCRPCHPTHYEEWQASMHAYAFEDPVFIALNEIAQERSNIGQFCVKCHSPFASLMQETQQGFMKSRVSPIARNGVSCDVCHASSDLTSGHSITVFRLDGTKNGPISDPQPNEFHQSEHFPLFAESAYCRPCHNVLLPNDFLVEKTSMEWNDSYFDYHSTRDTTKLASCQTCHMPSYQGQAAIDGPQREVHRHTFIGVDIPLIDFPGRERTIRQVSELLQNAVSMTVTAPQEISASDSINITVSVFNNKTGHNVPSGTIFHREMWIELILSDALSKMIVYSSGLLDGNSDLMSRNSEFVKNGTLPEDTLLTLFNGVAYKDGKETPFFWEATSVDNRTIPSYKSYTASYTAPGPFEETTLELSVRLRFRSLPPYLLREIGQNELIDDLVIFDMETTTLLIEIIH